MDQEKEFRLFRASLSAILWLNLIDATFTLVWVMGGFALEANPLMDYLLSESPAAFMGYKIFLVHLCVYLLWRLRTLRFARISVIPAVITYGCIAIYHVYSLTVII